MDSLLLLVEYNSSQSTLSRQNSSLADQISIKRVFCVGVERKGLEIVEDSTVFRMVVSTRGDSFAGYALMGL